MHRDPLLAHLTVHQPHDLHEAEMLQRTIAFVRAHADCFHRTLQIGHITGSAWIVDPTRTHALLLHHAKLQRWLQPGGHSDGNPHTLQVALREAVEETGLPETALRPLSTAPFDIDIHRIPARGTEPEHDHLDIRYCFQADPAITLAPNSESRDLRWIPLTEIHHYTREESIARMIAKTPPPQ